MPSSQTRRKKASKSPEKPAKVAPKETKTEKKPPQKKKEDETFVVEAILDKKKIKGRVLYLIKWLGYENESDNTWEPLKNLESVMEMVHEYNAALREKGDIEKENEEEEEEKEKELAEMSGNKEDSEEEEKEDEKPKSKKKKQQTAPKKAEPKPRTTKNTRRRNIEKEPLAPGEAPVKKLKTDKDLPPVTFGHFEFDDVPVKITKAFRKEETTIFNVQWKIRPDGFTPNPTDMTGLELRKYDKDLLLDFYEQRLKFVSNDKKKPSMRSLENKDVGRIVDWSPVAIDHVLKPETLNRHLNFDEKAPQWEDEERPRSIEDDVLEDIEGKKPERMEEEKVEEPKEKDTIEIEEEKVVPEENVIAGENASQAENVVNEEREEKETEHKEPEPMEIEEDKTVPAEPVIEPVPEEPINVEEIHLEEAAAEEAEPEVVNVEEIHEPVEEKEAEVVNVEEIREQVEENVEEIRETVEETAVEVVDVEEIRETVEENVEEVVEEVVEKVEVTEIITETQDSKVIETQLLITQEVVSNPIETAGSPAKSDSSTPNLFNYDPNQE